MKRLFGSRMLNRRVTPYPAEVRHKMELILIDSNPVNYKLIAFGLERVLSCFSFHIKKLYPKLPIATL